MTRPGTPTAGRPVFEAPVVIAHRGFGRGTSYGHPENSLAAFRAGLAGGVRWLEVDVRRSADDQLFVLHFPTTPDGSFLSDLPARDVPASVLRLDDLLAEVPPGVGIVLDVKTALEDALRRPDRTTGGLLQPVIAAEAARRPVVVTSFDPGVLLLTGAQLPGVPRGLITWLSFPLRKAVPAAAQLGVEAVCVHWRSFAANTTDPAPVHRPASYSVDIAHRAGLQVAAWTPTLDVAPGLLDAGVDALIVDDVAGGLALLASAATAG